MTLIIAAKNVTFFTENNTLKEYLVLAFLDNKSKLQTEQGLK